MKAMAGRAIAAVGVVLAFVSIWVDSLPGSSYWSGDGTIGAFCLLLACLAALAFAAGYTRPQERASVRGGSGDARLLRVRPGCARLQQTGIRLERAHGWRIAAGALIVIGAASTSPDCPAEQHARPGSRRRC